jgi:hypothetical protein
MVDTTSTQQKILSHLRQPMTTAQIAHALRLPVDHCTYAVTRLASSGKLTCLNPDACRSRLYWLSSSGIAEQARLRLAAGLGPIEHDLPKIDWKKYGSLCFTHRAIVVRTLRTGEPLQPSQIKRQALRNDPSIRFSSNNCRDVMRILRRLQIVRPVTVKRVKHFRYELTDEGLHCQRLLKQAEVRA